MFGSYFGFAGNAKYLFIDAINTYGKTQCYWIARTKKELKCVKQTGLPVFYRWSISGIYHSLTAYKYIFSSSSNDINHWIAGNARNISLWHGVGIKKLNCRPYRRWYKICSKTNIFARLYAPWRFRRFHLFLSTNPFQTDHFVNSFSRLSSEVCFESNYPRCFILNWEKNKLLDFIKRYEPVSTLNLVKKIERFDVVYLYMPTFRDTQSDFIGESIVFSTLNDLMIRKNGLFLLKLHPCDLSSNLTTLSQYSNIQVVDTDADIYPVLPFTDVLLTDYSSIYYDYILMRDKKVLLCPFDYKHYTSLSRDLTLDYEKYTPGKRAYTFHEMLIALEDISSLDIENRDWVINQFWGDNDASSPKGNFDLYHKIVSLN